MYEKMAVPLPDLNAYLERIGISKVSAPSEAFLDELVYAHQTHIPFEDLDSWRFHKPISLEIPDLFDKIVTHRRGGFCFEQNLLFTQVLRDLGFDVYTVFCRIFHGPITPDFPTCLHCAEIVRLPKGLFFCDVGFGGPQPPASIPVSSTFITQKQGEKWLIRKWDDQWFTLSREESGGKWTDILHFNLFRQTPQEFLAASYFCSNSPTVLFTNSQVIGLRTPKGSKNIMDDVYTKRENGNCERITMHSQEETDRILAEEFGIIL